jgi:outer membrane protein assembly factor BamA
MKKIYLVCLLLVITQAARAAMPADTTRQQKKLSLTPFPAFFITPEEGVGFGGLVVPVYNFGRDSLTRNSTGQLLAYYTTKKQSSLQLTYNIFTNRERYMLTGEVKFFDAPIFYYGIGNENDLSDSSLISYKTLNVQNRWVKQVIKYVFVGGQFQVNHITDASSRNPASKLQDRPLQERDGSTLAGLGPALVVDNRDNPLNSRSGIYAELGVFINRRTWGSEFNFTRYQLDIRRFLALNDRQVLAIQGLGKFSTGRVPFQGMANLGGHRIMRAFYDGRFRDRQMAALQAEFRQHVYGRIGLVAFASVGQVGDRLDSFGFGRLKRAAGGGLRLMLNRREKLNIRIDYAIGSDKASGLYFNIGEAF